MNLYEAIEIICKDYCKYPDIESGNKLADICDKCPMNKCEDLRWVDLKTKPQIHSFSLHTEVCDRPQMDCSLCYKESHCRAIKEADRKE